MRSFLSLLIDRTAGRGYDPVVAPRPGEIWKTKDGRLIVVDGVTGSAVSGNIAPLELDTQWQPLGPGMGAVDYRGAVQDFDDYEPIGPRWKATFTAAVAGPHPTQDAVIAVVQTLGTVERRQIGSTSGSTISQGASYELRIFALTAAEVEARLGDALRRFGGVRNLRVERTDGPPPIVVG